MIKQKTEMEEGGFVGGLSRREGIGGLYVVHLPGGLFFILVVEAGYRGHVVFEFGFRAGVVCGVRTRVFLDVFCGLTV